MIYLCPRLQRVAHRVGQSAHPYSSPDTARQHAAWRTIVHGDAKAANVFLRETAESELQVGLIDFQWCGFGLAATEVAHHILAAVDIEALSYDGSKVCSICTYYCLATVADMIEMILLNTIGGGAAGPLPRPACGGPG